MKQIFTLILSAFFCINSWSQNNVGINTEEPKAVLDINAIVPESAGILVPTIGKFPETDPDTNQNGMLIFLDKEIANSTGFEGFYFWDDENTTWQYIFQTKMVNMNLYKTIVSSEDGFPNIAPGSQNNNVYFKTTLDEIEAPHPDFKLENGNLVIGKTGMYSLYFTGAVYKGEGSTSATPTNIAIFVDGVEVPNLKSNAPLPSADNGDRSVNHTISAVINLTKDQVLSIHTNRETDITTTMGASSPYTLTLTYLD